MNRDHMCMWVECGRLADFAWHQLSSCGSLTAPHRSLRPAPQLSVAETSAHSLTPWPAAHYRSYGTPSFNERRPLDLNLAPSVNHRSSARTQIPARGLGLCRAYRERRFLAVAAAQPRPQARHPGRLRHPAPRPAHFTVLLPRNPHIAMGPHLLRLSVSFQRGSGPPSPSPSYPTLETVLYGANISDILTRFTHPVLDIIAWIPYGVIHFSGPFILAAFLWLFAPKPALKFYANAFGYMNFMGVIVQILLPCAAPCTRLFGRTLLHL